MYKETIGQHFQWISIYSVGKEQTDNNVQRERVAHTKTFQQNYQLTPFAIQMQSDLPNICCKLASGYGKRCMRVKRKSICRECEQLKILECIYWYLKYQWNFILINCMDKKHHNLKKSKHFGIYEHQVNKNSFFDNCCKSKLCCVLRTSIVPLFKNRFKYENEQSNYQ